MFNFLKNHPFPVEAYFENSTVLTFAVPKEDLLDFITDCLQLDTFNNEWGFIAIAMVQTKNLRPKGLPSFLGNDFYLIGYRIFFRYKNNDGKNIRGLYILKSETNKKKMEFFGNIFTHYSYSTTDITIEYQLKTRNIKSDKSNFHVVINQENDSIPLPLNSPFSNWKEARRFAGPLPFTFTFNEDKKEVLIIEGVRQNWTPQPIEIKDYKFEFLNSLNFKKVVLANVFEINNIPYFWKKGKKESWKK